MPIFWLILGGLGIYLVTRKEDASAPPKKVTVTGPGGSGSVVLKDGDKTIVLPKPPALPPGFPTDLASTAGGSPGALPEPTDPKVKTILASLPTEIAGPVETAYATGTDPDKLDALASSLAVVSPQAAELIANKARAIRLAKV